MVKQCEDLHILWIGGGLTTRRQKRPAENDAGRAFEFVIRVFIQLDALRQYAAVMSCADNSTMKMLLMISVPLPIKPSFQVGERLDTSFSSPTESSRLIKLADQNTRREQYRDRRQTNNVTAAATSSQSSRVSTGKIPGSDSSASARSVHRSKSSISIKL